MTKVDRPGGGNKYPESRFTYYRMKGKERSMGALAGSAINVNRIRLLKKSIGDAWNTPGGRESEKYG